MKKICFIPAAWLLAAVLLLPGCSTDTAVENSEAGVPVKNVIFMIGDGMGLAQLSSTMEFAEELMALESAQYVGLAKTYSANNKVTDSAASGTALATGTKTRNRSIGVDPQMNPLTSILERADAAGLATGLVATYAITNATPAAFIGHVENRKMEEDIATYFVHTDIDLFIGGGRDMFEKRTDGRNLSDSLRRQDYRVVYTMDELRPVKEGKVAAMLADMHLPKMRGGRDDFLPEATDKALEILQANGKNGFFVMIEGSMIDGGGHSNDIEMVVAETIDFDKAVRRAFDFADRNPGTLVVVTADHETGGLTMTSGENGGLRYEFSTTGHTGIMVPVYSYGTGAEHFTGIMENIDIPRKMIELLNLE